MLQDWEAQASSDGVPGQLLGVAGPWRVCQGIDQVRWAPGTQSNLPPCLRPPRWSGAGISALGQGQVRAVVLGTVSHGREVSDQGAAGSRFTSRFCPGSVA